MARTTEPPRCNDLEMLHPDVKPAFIALSHALGTAFQAGNTSVLFQPFETYRTPMRQAWLLQQQPPRTKVGPWRSAHQYGRAVDFVPIIEGGWTWNASELEWRFLHEMAEQHGLRAPIQWDRPHIEAQK